MRLLVNTFIVLTLLTTAAPLHAQDTLPYEWEAVNISLRYPANWDVPLPGEQNGRPVLELAQVLVDTPADVRPPAVPIITLTIFPDSVPADGNLLPFLFAALQSLGIAAPDEPSESDFLGEPVPRLTGTSADGQFFAVGQVGLVSSSDVLVVIGRAVSAQQNDFLPIFDAVASSINARGREEATPESEAESDVPAYGVVWHLVRTQADGAESFLNLIGLALGPNNQLYSYEHDLGVVQVDAAAGSVISVSANPNITDPTDLAVASDGTVYVADATCGCIFSLTSDGVWLDQPENEEHFDPSANPGIIAGFGDGAPSSLTIGPGDQLYATDITSANMWTVQIIENGVTSQTIPLDASLVDPPVLGAASSGAVFALTQSGELLELTGSEAVLVNTPGPIADRLIDLAITPEGNLVVATSNQGILILTPDGEFVDQPGSIVPHSPLPGELVAPRGVAADAQGGLYFADSDGTFGAITAMSLAADPTRLGTTSLIPDLSVQGALDSQTDQQEWTYAGDAGERVTITVVDNTGLGTLDLSVRLLGPDGTEVAFNDDHASPDLSNFTDAQIVDTLLPAAGEYRILVDQVEGDGEYSLGLSLTRMLSVDSSGVARAAGELGEALPVHIWEFSGSAGQIYTITLETTSGDLDTLLRLFGPDGTLVAENDDADDSVLGTDAQIAAVNLPADGVYRLEAARFDGSGDYTLTVAATP